MVKGLLASTAESLNVLAGHTSLIAAPLYDTGRGLLQSQTGPAPGPASGGTLSLTADVQVCCSMVMCSSTTCMSLLTACVMVLQIPVAAKLKVTCPFVVPFNQASQVPNCWPTYMSATKACIIDTAKQHLCFAPTNLWCLLTLDSGVLSHATCSRASALTASNWAQLAACTTSIFTAPRDTLQPRVFAKKPAKAGTSHDTDSLQMSQ